MRPMTPVRALLWGTLVVGVLDILDALIFFSLRGASPIRILQSIASGLLGRSAYQGGLRTAFIGLFLHFVVAFCIVCVYFLATRVLPSLNRRPLVYGAVYGLVAYFGMNYVIVPLSAAVVGTGPTPMPVLINGLLIHMLGVGIPSALVARAATASRGGTRI
jgi:uncharacterized membrane protein YagU involved in acid resistance